MNTSKTLNFCYCFDSNFNTQAFISLISLLDNVNEKINIYILHNTDYLKALIPQKILNHLNLNNLEIYKFNNSNYVFPNLNNVHISEATYYRIFISEYLRNVEFCIYIDADTVVLKDPVGEFREKIENFDQEFVGARSEIILDQLNNIDLNNKNNFLNRLSMNSDYFNAGVMILNLKRFREFNLQNKLLKRMGILDSKIIQWDQDVLNSYFNGNYIRIDSGLNSFASEFNKNNIENIKILHYLGSKKPWLTSGIFENSSKYYHLNYRKLFVNYYHIEHKWILGSLKELLVSFYTMKFFNLDNRYFFIKELIYSLIKINKANKSR